MQQRVRILGTSWLDRLARWCLHHWLAILNMLVLLYGGLPWLAPLLALWGYPTAAHLLFHLYSPLCHQNPERSFTLAGHQVAFCHREAAMYTTLFVGGVLFAVWRRHLRPIRLRHTGLLLLPMLLDGLTQYVNDLLPTPWLRGSDHSIGSFNWWARMVTGVLFAIAVVLGIYTRLERDLRE